MFDTLLAPFSSFGISIVSFIVVLSIIVVIHELGHYWAGRICGMEIKAFSLGFGPELFSITDKQGVRWRIAALPLGGYVKFAGDENAASVPSKEVLNQGAQPGQENWFHFKPLYQRAFVIAAGPIANFLLAIIVFAGLYSIVGKQITLPYVDEVMENSAAEEAGILPGDLILKVDGKEIPSFNELTRVISVSADQELVISIKRSNDIIELPVTPKGVEIKDRFGAPLFMGRLGISRAINETSTKYVTEPIFTAISSGIDETGYVIARTVGFLKEIILGEQSFKQFGGPVKIAEVSGIAAQNGAASLIQLIAFISISIGFFNLLPIPPLDGGHLLFYVIEAVIRRPVDEKIQMIGFQFGLACMLSLMLFATWNDLLSLYQRLIGA